jgi:hypothetical protein
MIQILKFLKFTDHIQIKLFLILVLTILFAPLFFSKLSLIDDHEIISFLNAYKIDGIKGVWNQFFSLGDFNELTRFRPIYYLIRIIEIFTWRDNAFFWAFFRFCIATMSSLYIFEVARKKYSIFISLSLALLLFCLPVIPDIFFRFGPSETYAIVFFVLLTGTLIQNRNSDNGLIKTSIYITLLIGIKENFVILFPLQIYALFKTIKTKNIYYSLISLFLSLISLICIYIIFRKIQFNSGADVYNTVIGHNRIDLILNSFLSKLGFIFLSLSSLIIYYLLALWPEKRQNLKLDNYFLIAIFSCLILFNIFIYSGIPSPRSRYAFPIWPLMVFVFFILSKKYLSFRANQKKWVPNTKILCLIICLTLTFGLLINLSQNFKTYKSSNQTFDSIKKAIDLSRQYKIIIVHAQGENNYEKSYSIVKFLNFYSNTKMVYLILDTNDNKIDNANNPLFKVMQNISTNGGWGYLGLKNTLLLNKECLNIYFELKNGTSPCHNDEKIILR